MINNLLILGDSYSTFYKNIPEGYAAYYFPYMVDEKCPVRMMRLEETWWRRFIEKTDANLIRNDSWSGTTICYTGYNNTDCSNTHSFIYRYRRLCNEGFFNENKIDTVIVFGGTNDSWANAPLGEAKLSDFTEDELFSVFPAISYLMSRLKEDIPDARIIFIANCDIKPEIREFMKSAAEHFEIDFVSLSGRDKLNGHPTPLGMEQICEQVLSVVGG